MSIHHTNRSDPSRVRQKMLAQLTERYQINLKPLAYGRRETRIYRAVRIYDAMPVAIKICVAVTDLEYYGYRSEAAIMQQLNHPNLMQCYQFVNRGASVALVMELADTDLYYIMIARHSKSHNTADLEWRAVRDTLQVARAVRHLHDNHVCHLDIKPENVMAIISPKDPSRRILKLGDFGMAGVYPPASRVTRSMGTPNYAAPEMFLPLPNADPYAVDIYSLGSTLFVLCTNHPLYQVECPSDLPAAVMAGKFTLPDTLSRPVRDLLMEMLDLNPVLRPSINEVCIRLEQIRSAPRPCDAQSSPTSTLTPTLSPTGSILVESRPLPGETTKESVKSNMADVFVDQRLMD